MTATTKQPDTRGLAGQTIGDTQICSVGQSHLIYRGYEIADLAAHATFEEVAFLLIEGRKPSSEELEAFRIELSEYANPDPSIIELVQQIARTSPKAHPMCALRTAVSAASHLDPDCEDNSPAAELRKAKRLVASIPTIIGAHQRALEGKDAVKPDPSLSHAANLLMCITGERPGEIAAKVMDVSLILYAEHDFNASTFTCRVIASTMSDMHSCITGAIGSLRGPLHGGANEAAMDMIEKWSSPDEAEKGLLAMLERKEKVMGFGHAIYRESDPRNLIIKGWAKNLAKQVGDAVLYPVSERCEEVMWREKKLFCNADFFHASAYHFMDIPTKLFTPIFVMSRVVGWAAHVKEQRANNRIIRPSADYTGPETAEWVDIRNR